MSYLANFGKLQSLKAYGENIIPGKEIDHVIDIRCLPVTLLRTVYNTFILPAVNDVCSVANGRCSTFCLPSFRYHKCACPDGVKLLADKRTCSGGNPINKNCKNVIKRK